MKRRYIILMVFMLSSAMLFSCNGWVTDVDPFIDTIADERLDDPEQVPFSIIGVKQTLSNSTDDVFAFTGLLADEFIFDFDIPGATWIQLQDINDGIIVLDNFSVVAVNRNIGTLRFYADDLIRRIDAVSGIEAAVEKEARYLGNFYGGLARSWAASYLGIDKSTGGVAINNSPIMTNNQAYDLAIEKMKEALQYAADYEKRIVNTSIARAYLYKGEYASAATHAALGLVSGDAPFQALYTEQASTFFNREVGSQRNQMALDPRFQAYVDADATEAGRIVLFSDVGASGTTYYRQSKYLTNSSPINIASWQENHLMLAELILRGAAAGDALALVNAVRASHSVAAATSVVLINDAAPNDPNITSIYTERDKELFTTGSRVPDQHRFDKWHLGADRWKYMPLVQSELDYNPNLQ